MEEHLAPSSPGLPGTGAEDGSGPQRGGLDDPRVLQILSTEHWGLLSARSLVYNEAFARAGMFLTFLSASLVALALAGQAMTFDRQFLGLAAGILIFDVAIGLATLGRMSIVATDDLRSIRDMNRIRNAYVQIAPWVEPYLGGSIHDDPAGVGATYGGAATTASPITSLLHGLSTSAGMIGIIVTLLIGLLVGDGALLAGTGPDLATVIGALALVVAFGLIGRRSAGSILAFEASLEVRYPGAPRT